MERNCELSLNVIDPHINDLPDTSKLSLLESHGKRALRTIGQFAATDIPGLFASILARLHPSPKLKIEVNGIQLVPNKPETNPSIVSISTLKIHYQREETDGFVWDFNWLYEIASLLHQSQIMYHFTHRTEANGHGMLAIEAMSFCFRMGCKYKGKSLEKEDMEKNPYLNRVVNEVFKGDVKACERFHAHPYGRGKEGIAFANLLRSEDMGDTYNGILAPRMGFDILASTVKTFRQENKLGFRPPIIAVGEFEFIGRYYWPSKIFNFCQEHNPVLTWNFVKGPRNPSKNE